MLTRVILQAISIGAEWVLYLLFFLSFASVAVMFERWIYFARRRINADVMRDMIAARLGSGDVRGAHDALLNSRSVEGRVLAAGLEAAARGPQACSEAMLSVKARERVKMDAGLSLLATIGSNAPFIGLLGTVLGIINAAHELTRDTSQAGQSAVLSGVFEALVATAVGLFVAIPAVAAYNLFQRRVRSRMAQVDSLAHYLLSVFPFSSPPPNN